MTKVHRVQSFSKQEKHKNRNTTEHVENHRRGQSIVQICELPGNMSKEVNQNLTKMPPAIAK